MASRFDPHGAAVKGAEGRLRNTGYMPAITPLSEPSAQDDRSGRPHFAGVVGIAR
jgi:hypothetical protein